MKWAMTLSFDFHQSLSSMARGPSRLPLIKSPYLGDLFEFPSQYATGVLQQKEIVKSCSSLPCHVSLFRTLFCQCWAHGECVLIKILAVGRSEPVDEVAHALDSPVIKSSSLAEKTSNEMPKSNLEKIENTLVLSPVELPIGSVSESLSSVLGWHGSKQGNRRSCLGPCTPRVSVQSCTSSYSWMPPLPGHPRKRGYVWKWIR